MKTVIAMLMALLAVGYAHAGEKTYGEVELDGASILYGEMPISHFVHRIFGEGGNARVVAFGAAEDLAVRMTDHLRDQGAAYSEDKTPGFELSEAYAGPAENFHMLGGAAIKPIYAVHLKVCTANGICGEAIGLSYRKEVSLQMLRKATLDEGVMRAAKKYKGR